MGEVGLKSGGGMYVPSKSNEYLVANLFFRSSRVSPLGGLAENTPVEEVCLVLFALAELTLSLVIFFSNLSMSLASAGAGGGDSLAIADFTLRSLVVGLSFFRSAMVKFYLLYVALIHGGKLKERKTKVSWCQ